MHDKWYTWFNVIYSTINGIDVIKLALVPAFLPANRIIENHEICLQFAG